MDSWLHPSVEEIKQAVQSPLTAASLYGLQLFRVRLPTRS
jgi:hypothetical protein